MSPEDERKILALFARLNTEHFAGSLQPPKKLLKMSFGGRFAFYMPKVHIIGFHPRTLQQSDKYISDSLLHEMIHYALEVRTGDHAQAHGNSFIMLANEIGGALGLPAATAANVEEWPQSVRPVDYAPWR